MNVLLAQLDRWLAVHGELIYLRRGVGSGNQSYVQCEIKAKIDPLVEEQLVGDLAQQKFLIIISPSYIIKAQWPGGKTPAASGNIIARSDPRIPISGDIVILRGIQKELQRVEPVFDHGACVRIEMTAVG